MYRYVSLERWADLRATRRRGAPTFPRVAAAADLNVTTVRDHASRHNWAKQPFQSRNSGTRGPGAGAARRRWRRAR
jgi:hypothetical protein